MFVCVSFLSSSNSLKWGGERIVLLISFIWFQMKQQTSFDWVSTDWLSDCKCLKLQSMKVIFLFVYLFIHKPCTAWGLDF